MSDAQIHGYKLSPGERAMAALGELAYAGMRLRRALGTADEEGELGRFDAIVAAYEAVIDEGHAGEGDARIHILKTSAPADGELPAALNRERFSDPRLIGVMVNCGEQSVIAVGMPYPGANVATHDA